MQSNVTLDEFNMIISVLNVIKLLGLLGGHDFIVTWEQKPQLIINQLGEFEFSNPQELYGCVITMWGKELFGDPVSKTRFTISSGEE